MATELRPELEALPERMRELPVDARGYVVPWFVAWIDGPEGRIPEFRAMDGKKFIRAIREKLCWVCGSRLGSYVCFVIGPMCGINRISSEPPSHLECAQWSARNCPFLSRPEMVRRESGPGADPELVEEAKRNAAGVMIERNPGVTLLWICRGYKVEQDGKGGHLLRVGEPEHVMWYTRGQPATRAEVEQAVESGLPLLLDVAKSERGGVEEVARQYKKLEALYPTPARSSVTPEPTSVMPCNEGTEPHRGSQTP